METTGMPLLKTGAVIGILLKTEEVPMLASHRFVSFPIFRKNCADAHPPVKDAQ